MNIVQLICCALLTKVADLATDQTIGARVGEIVGSRSKPAIKQHGVAIREILAGGSRRLITGDIQGAFDELKIAGSEICFCPSQANAKEESTRRRLRNYQKSWQKSRKYLKFDKP